MLNTYPKRLSSITFACDFVFSQFFKPPLTTKQMSSSSPEQGRPFVTYMILSFSADELHTDFSMFYCYIRAAGPRRYLSGGVRAVSCPLCRQDKFVT